MSGFENLTRYLQNICNYNKLDVVSVSYSLFNLQNICRDCKNKLEKIRHTITSDQIEEIYNTLADAKTKWTSNVGEAKMIWVPGDPYSGGGSMEVEPGIKNELIHNVTRDLGSCLHWCLNIKKELKIIEAKGPPSFIPTPDSTIRPPDDDMTDTWHSGIWDGTPKNKMHTADVQTLLHRMKKINI